MEMLSRSKETSQAQRLLEVRANSIRVELEVARQEALVAMQKLATAQATADGFVEMTGLDPLRGEYDNPPAHLASFMRVWKDMNVTVSIQEIANDL